MAQEIVFVIDRSGSMKGAEGDTIGGYNSFLEKQRREEGSAYVTTVLFDHEQELLHDRVELQNVSPLTDRNYYVRGSTALRDAIASTIHKIDAIPQTDGVIFVTITDGRENASKHYTHNQVRALIEEKQKVGWTFLFLGADLADLTDAEQMGIRAERRASFSKDKSHMVYEEMSASISAFRKTKQIPKDWADRIQGRQEDVHSARRPIMCRDLVYIDTDTGRALIDTGSPCSFGVVPHIDIQGNRFPLATIDLMRDIQKYLGKDIITIVGMDILASFDLILQYDSTFQGFRVTLSREVLALQQRDLALKTVMGVPVLPVTIGGEAMQLCLDTGSTMTYLRRELICGKVPVGKYADFHPLLGDFITPTYHVQIELQGHTCTVLAGSLPESLASSLPNSIKGVIGTDVLKHFHVALKFRSGMFHIERAAN